MALTLSLTVVAVQINQTDRRNRNCKRPTKRHHQDLECQHLDRVPKNDVLPDDEVNDTLA